MKVAGTKHLAHEGPAKVYDGERACFEAVTRGEIVNGDVVVILYEGPKGGPGMQEMLAVTGAIMGQSDLGSNVLLITDGRFSGATHGPMIGHAVPRGGGRRQYRPRSGRRHDSHGRRDPGNSICWSPTRSLSGGGSHGRLPRPGMNVV